MKGYRFYLEFESPKSKRRGEHTGNVFALFTASPPYYSYVTEGLSIWVQTIHRQRELRAACSYVTEGLSIEGAGAVFFEPDSPVCGCSISLEYLQTRCKRISESKAREIHPRLFDYLDRGL